MTIQDFAAQYRLRARRDTCGEATIPCRRGGQLFELRDGIFGVLTESLTVRAWGSIRKRLRDGGFKLRQNGDREGILSFDPSDPEQAELAIKVMRAVRKRRLSPEQKVELSRRFQVRPKSELGPPREEGFVTLESTRALGCQLDTQDMRYQAGNHFPPEIQEAHVATAGAGIGRPILGRPWSYGETSKEA